MKEMDSTTKEKILIVDDSPVNLKMLRGLLTGSGYEVACFSNANDAFLELAKNRYDLILLDIIMPEIDGFEACRQIKKMRIAKEIPVIFLTALDEINSVVEGFSAGGVDYITKPFNSTELRVRIKTHIELKRAKEEIKTLQGLIPICAQCKAIRDDEGVWTAFEDYVKSHTKACFTHGLCKKCADKRFGGEQWYQNKCSHCE